MIKEATSSKFLVSGEFSCAMQIHTHHTHLAAEISTESSAVPGSHTNTTSTHTDITTTMQVLFLLSRPPGQGFPGRHTPSLTAPSLSTRTHTSMGLSNTRAVCPHRVWPESLPRAWAPFVQPPALTLVLSDLAGLGWSSVAAVPQLITGKREKALPQFTYI